MTDPDRLDLSPLDPGRDPEHWSDFLAVTRLRVEAAMERVADTRDPVELLAGWLRPVLAAAAVLVALLGSARLLVGGRGAALEHASEARRLAALSDESLGHGLRPSGAQLLVALRSRSAP
jgi:hypothetical protein